LPHPDRNKNLEAYKWVTAWKDSVSKVAECL
jgi:hypothetical protein